MTYKCLINQTFTSSCGQYSIVPIRDEDKYLIRKWRNEQIYHLRQPIKLSIEDQETYFRDVVPLIFEAEKPNQILFSYLSNNDCIGYGGLVHINWIDSHAEISFIINTELEKYEFEFHWLTFLSLIEKVAFNEIDFHKIFTLAFDLRPHLYYAVEKAGFKNEARLKEHYIWEGKFIDAVIHTKYNNHLKFRVATFNDLLLYFKWANDELVRTQSFNNERIDLSSHTQWFNNKLANKNCFLYVGEVIENVPVGQVRIEIQESNDRAIVGVSLDEKFRGKGLGNRLLKGAVKLFKMEHPNIIIDAYIKNSNSASINLFASVGFKYVRGLYSNGCPSSMYSL